MPNFRYKALTQNGEIVHGTLAAPTAKEVAHRIEYLRLLPIETVEDKVLVSLLRAGEKIVIFPEGTYIRNGVGSGKSRLLQMILKFQSELGYPIPFIPVGIRYGERSGWRRRVEVCIGSPLFAERESDALPLTNRAIEEISHLCRLPICSQ